MRAYARDMDPALASVWGAAAEADPSLEVRRRHEDALMKKRLKGRRHDRAVLFQHLARGRPVLFTDLDIPVRVDRGRDFPQQLMSSIARTLPRSAKARVQIGPSKRRRQLPVREVAERWKRGRSTFGVTDLHFRGTRLENLVDTRTLSDFNVLLECPEPARLMEMMTLVISTPGNVTESHTDDCDGSNHCFAGRKLWLAWDRVAGQEVGLQDVTHDDVSGPAAFDLDAFLSLRSARWFVIKPGETLFLPGHLTHKVVTLEPYLGVGSFFVALPSYLRSLSRWTNGGAADVTDEMLVQIHSAVRKRVGRLKGSSTLRRRWGADEARRAVSHARALGRSTTRQDLFAEAIALLSQC